MGRPPFELKPTLNRSTMPGGGGGGGGRDSVAGGAAHALAKTSSRGQRQ